jgi:hypothetical protein
VSVEKSWEWKKMEIDERLLEMRINDFGVWKRGFECLERVLLMETVKVD